jgi:lactoylglutathione lyase
MSGLIVLALQVAGAPIAAPGPVPGAAPAAARGDHVAIAVADVDASAAFYRRWFGLAELRSPVAGPRWLDLGGGMALHLFPGRRARVGEERRTHLALAVADFDAFVARLTAERVPFVDFTGRAATIQTIRGDGVRQIFIRDPDGYWIEVNDAAARRG